MPEFPKTTPIVLDPDAYAALRLRVMARDQWRCRRCSELGSLEVHHLKKRSAGRLDVDTNLVSLCGTCHRLVEAHRVLILGDDANAPLRFRYADSGPAPL